MTSPDPSPYERALLALQSGGYAVDRWFTATGYAIYQVADRAGSAIGDAASVGVPRLLHALAERRVQGGLGITGDANFAATSRPEREKKSAENAPGRGPGASSIGQDRGPS